MKYKDIIAVNNGLMQLSINKGIEDFKIKVRIARNIKKLSAEIEVYDGLRKELIESVKIKDSDKYDEVMFDKELRKLLDIDVAIDIEKINESELSDEAKKQIDARTLVLLDPIFVYADNTD